MYTTSVQRQSWLIYKTRCPSQDELCGVAVQGGSPQTIGPLLSTSKL